MKRESLLVVEDEDILRESLVDWFENDDRAVESVEDGEKALEKFKVDNYDVMIVDLKLPGRDGLSVLREVKVLNPKVRVIIITAYPSVETAVEAMRGGAVDYIPKPFEMERLEDSIRKLEETGVASPPVEAPSVEEKTVAPCIWMQAGIVANRTCQIGYQCTEGCDFHAAMMRKEKFSGDPRISPFLEKLDCLSGKSQCRYVMNGDISFRCCPNLFHCESCEFDQIVQDQIDEQLRRKKQARRFRSVPDRF